jgi:chromosomal replication initiation ATPase DnaA
LPFPFVGPFLPTRFKPDSGSGSEGNWFYVGREKFVELLDRLRDVRKSHNRSALWVYGTKGYGKSHLLAALVCYLTAQGERVVYIPDCRECAKKPVAYVRAAMLFAWADDKTIQDEIITLDTQEKIENFLDCHLNAIFCIDQVNGFAETESEVKKWLDSCRAWHKAILSTSANYKSYLEMVPKQSTEETMYVYGGFTAVSLSKELLLRTGLFF